MSLWTRLAERLGRLVLGKVVEEVEDRLLETEEEPMPLSHKHSEIQAKASREAGHIPRCGRCLEPINGHALGCPLSAGQPVSSPRAITERHTIVPPPRKPRKR